MNLKGSGSPSRKKLPWSSFLAGGRSDSGSNIAASMGMGMGEGEGDVFRGHPRRVGDEACATDVVTDVDERQSDGADPPHGEPGKRGVGDPLPPVAGFSRSVDTMFSLSS